MGRVLRLPRQGRLLVCTDLQGHLPDFRRMAQLFRQARIEAQGEAHLLFTGDLIHGPHLSEDEWPSFLGDYYRDQSPEVMREFVALRRSFPGHVHAILGNHEHAHIGGPHTAKFAADEVVLLEATLGPEGSRWLCEVLRPLPLVAVAPCGVIFTHGAPAAEVGSVDEIENVLLEGFDLDSPIDVFSAPIIGPLLWARSAAPTTARRFLEVMGGRLSVYGHDVIPEGYECIGDEQMIVSTSFGLANADKVYLDLNLGARYRNVHDLREGKEILPLYPEEAISIKLKRRRRPG